VIKIAIFHTTGWQQFTSPGSALVARADTIIDRLLTDSEFKLFVVDPAKELDVFVAKMKEPNQI